jgi:protein-S-isoprenylcysteine O-methyltransferase Ste14
MARRIFALLRTLVVAPLFILLWLWWLPRWIAGPNVFADPRPLGWIVVAIGAVVGLPCVWEFAWRGLGTPAPFDPPRKLVISGPYRYVRNPMYVGMGIAMLGFAIVFPHGAVIFLSELVIAFVLVSLFIVFYEEPTLRRMFGDDYLEYCRNVRRWIPRLTPFDKRPTAA